MRPINKRNKYKNIGNRSILNKPNTERMKDARQILKLKRSKQQMKNFYSINTKTNFNRKQFKPINFERIVSPGKQVLIKKGMITVTSEQKPVSTCTSTSTSNSEVTSAEKFVFLDRNGITVMKRNSMPTSKVSSTDNDISYADDDDLEKMTLDDLPEANKLKTITSNFQDNFNSLQSWSNSPATSRVLQNHSDSTNGYNILVTNLHREVNKTDIVVSNS
ncbi:uncharacterized protein LOC111642587 isoform X2 [Centruroides sculpturatus]|uniref:uncharacterized protein LOC111642587 isoform X2 n=1 Tax=Centruroides sculpturatus TaxID=218467 RepID=UPI000C6D4882|nr:uncharacterized protein LOC111642587 isoform X2 [Centruroides sculpturatus]